MSSEPICIRRTATVEEADILVAWLAERGIPATVADRDNPGAFAFGVTDTEGIEVFVANEETARRAKELLAELDREHAAEHGAEGAEEVVEVTCEECECSCSFSAAQRGSVQQCPECGAYVDVPTDS